MSNTHIIAIAISVYMAIGILFAGVMAGVTVGLELELKRPKLTWLARVTLWPYAIATILGGALAGVMRGLANATDKNEEQP